MRVYLTHCCAKKDDALQSTGEAVRPDRLYLAKPTQRFMARCKQQQVEWAIFSDEYGVWSPDKVHLWYEKPPKAVTPAEFERLLADFEHKLEKYDEIWFYRHPAHFHPLYRKMLEQTRLRDRVRLFSHIREIVRV